MTMKTRILPLLAVALLTTGFGMSAASADDPKLEATKSGKELFCRAKVKVNNKLDQTIQLDKIRISSSEEPGFYSEFELSGSRYRPVSGASLPMPMLEVMVPSGHKLVTEISYRKQITAGKDAKFSQPKSDKWGAGAIQAPCTLAGQELTVTINE
jgi:hypothetical protein